MARYNSPSCGDAAIQQPGNIRMLQASQNLPFLTKSLPEEVGRKGQVNQFDRNFLLEMPVGAMRQVDSAHAAASQQAIKQISTGPLRFGCNLPAGFRLQPAKCRFVFFRFAGFEQRIHLGCERPVPFASGLDQFIPRLIWSRESFMEDRLNEQKVFRRLFHLGDYPVCIL